MAYFDKGADDAAMARVKTHLRAYLESIGFKFRGNGDSSCKCVFHGDKTDSAKYYERDKNGGGEPHLYCWQSGCVGRADIFKAIMVWEGCDFKEAKRRAFEFAGEPLVSSFSTQKKGRRKLTERERRWRDYEARRQAGIYGR